MAADDLPVTAYVVLGLLSHLDEQLSAVEIKSRADISVAQFYWPPALSHIRHELARLLERGWVEEQEVADGSSRASVLYSATPAGVAALRAWSESSAADNPVMLKHSVLLRVWVGRDADPTRMVEVLDEYLAATEARIEDLLWTRRRQEELDVHQLDQLRRPRAVSDYVLRSLYAELANSRQLRDELARGTAADPAARVVRNRGELRRRDRAIGVPPA